MNKISLIIAFFITSVSFSQLPSYLPTNGLVGWWPFNGNANDESGNGNNGTVNGATLTTDRNGVANKAYSFDGINDYILTSFNGISGNASRTISVWFSTTSFSSAQTLISYGQNNTPSNVINIWKNTTCNGIGIDISNSYKDYTNTLTSGQWYNFTLVINSSQGTTLGDVKMYQNGTLLSSICGSTGLSTNINTLLQYAVTFGKYHSQSILYLNGKLDDIGIWNRALTEQEITNLYNGVYNLPVELTQFSATCSENATNINWQTASEHNSAYFEVFKSRDGETWNSLATVDAAGNSSEAINYSISDNTDATTFYYKLIQVDKDGKSKEYGPISANCTQNTSLSISPNPTIGEFNLVGMEHFGTITALELIDATGKVVKELQPTTTQFSCNELKTGVYFLVVSAGKTQEVIKIIKE